MGTSKTLPWGVGKQYLDKTEKTPRVKKSSPLKSKPLWRPHREFIAQSQRKPLFD